MTPAMSVLKAQANGTSCKSVSHTSQAMDRFESYPSERRSTESSHTTPTEGSCRAKPHDKSCKHVGHRASAMGWSNLYPNENRLMDTGHTTRANGFSTVRKPSRRLSVFTAHANKGRVYGAFAISSRHGQPHCLMTVAEVAVYEAFIDRICLRPKRNNRATLRLPATQMWS